MQCVLVMNNTANIMYTFYVLIHVGEDIGFRRYSYMLPGDDRTLVHYLGDHMKVQAIPHGNSTSSNRYTRTCPSVLRTLPTEHQLVARILNVSNNDSILKFYFQSVYSIKCESMY